MDKARTFVMLIAPFLLLSCVSNSPAQKGYDKCKNDLKESLYVPDSLKINNATCYESIIEKYKITEAYTFQYKINYSAKSRAGLEISDVIYYGYSDESKQIKCYFTDSSTYNSAVTTGSKIEIKK